jgi:hypothetical protein
MSTPAENVQLYRGRARDDGTCNACRRLWNEPDVPEEVFVLSLGENAGVSVRFCPDCLEHLRRLVNAVPVPP